MLCGLSKDMPHCAVQGFSMVEHFGDSMQLTSVSTLGLGTGGTLMGDLERRTGIRI